MTVEMKVDLTHVHKASGIVKKNNHNKKGEPSHLLMVFRRI
jgi:hypothetical protein